MELCFDPPMSGFGHAEEGFSGMHSFTSRERIGVPCVGTTVADFPVKWKKEQNFPIKIHDPHNNSI